jgi:hypothetical protein
MKWQRRALEYGVPDMPAVLVLPEEADGGGQSASRPFEGGEPAVVLLGDSTCTIRDHRM